MSNTPRAIPTVGRMVRYSAIEADHAAIVTEVDEPENPESKVGLAIFRPTGLQFLQHVAHGYDYDCWSWPPITPIPRS